MAYGYGDGPTDFVVGGKESTQGKSAMGESYIEAVEALSEAITITLLLKASKD